MEDLFSTFALKTYIPKTQNSFSFLLIWPKIFLKVSTEISRISCLLRVIKTSGHCGRLHFR